MKKLLDKFRQRFLEKKIQESISALKSSSRKLQKPIKTIGCIVDTSLDLDYSDILDLAFEIGLKEKDFKIISFSNSIYNDPFCEMRLSKKSVNFYGKLISADAEEFTSKKYDMLINYFGNNKILTFMCNLFINLNLTDMETGYKVFKKNPDSAKNGCVVKPP